MPDRTKAKIGPTILVIIGISGDLASRKLLPALHKIKDAGMLPANFNVLGVTRRDFDLSPLFAENDPFQKQFEVFKMDLAEPKDYVALKKRLEDIENSWQQKAQYLFYLSIPPHAVLPVAQNIGQAGLGPKSKLLLEKPFGTDLASAQELITGIDCWFPEEKVFRIDHYLAKEMAQNLVIFRKENSLFRRTWNNQFIERIRIVASEKIGIEGRSAFYEQTGALRDLVQSHLLQLAALVTLQLPPDSDWSSLPIARAEALKKLRIKISDKGLTAKRAQYSSYRIEAKNPKSEVETFAALTLESSDPTWLNVPIEIVTGKALDRKATEIEIFYKQDGADEANKLVLRVGSDEGVGVCLWTKRPGYDHSVEKRQLDFSYGQHYSELPEAYERVFVDALRSDQSLFASGAEVLASWKILEPVRANWESNGASLATYENGSSIEQILNQ